MTITHIIDEKKINKDEAVNFAAAITSEAIEVFTYGGLQAVYDTMNELYKNVFLYPMVEDEYNYLSFDSRQAINEIHALVTGYAQLVMQYEGRAWTENDVVIRKADAAAIEALFAGLSKPMDEYVKLIDQLIITTILYKPVREKQAPTDETINKYFYCNQIKSLFCGYKGLA